MLGWWVHAFENPCKSKSVTLLIRLVLNVDKHGTKTCDKCQEFTCDSLDHILFECDVSADIRFKLWNDVLEKATNRLSKELIK